MRMQSIRLSLVLLLAAAPIACGDAGEDELQDELELAMEGDSLAQEFDDLPAESDEPITAEPSQAAPRQSDPAPTPAAEPEPEEPAFTTVTAEPGTTFQVTLNQELSTKTNREGDLFTATLDEPIMSGGDVVVPAGATVRGEVTAVQKSGGAGETAVIKVAFDELSFDGNTYPLGAQIVEAEVETKGESSTGEEVAKIGGGAAAGAILGRVIGGDATGAIVGGVLGAAAGTAITMGTEDVNAVMPEGAAMTLELTEPISVQKAT